MIPKSAESPVLVESQVKPFVLLSDSNVCKPGWYLAVGLVSVLIDFAEQYGGYRVPRIHLNLQLVQAMFTLTKHHPVSTST